MLRHTVSLPVVSSLYIWGALGPKQDRRDPCMPPAAASIFLACIDQFASSYVRRDTNTTLSMNQPWRTGQRLSSQGNMPGILG